MSYDHFLKCENCKFSSPRTPLKLIREKWEEDPRPVAKTWWQSWSIKYKSADPYNDEWDKGFDDARERDNANLIYCDRFPERKVVNRKYGCGEHKDKPYYT